jgi:hypothetical protein
MIIDAIHPLPDAAYVHESLAISSGAYVGVKASCFEDWNPFR